MEEGRGGLQGGLRLRGAPSAAAGGGPPLVSVITAVLNGEKYIEDCIKSVQAQSYPNVEHVVFDGGSRDGTIQVLRKWDDRLTFWISEPDAGIYDAWNKALHMAHGTWLCFVGADDILMQDAIDSYMLLAVNHPEAEYLSSRIEVLHPSGYIRVLGSPWRWKVFSRTMCTPHVGSMHRRSLFDRLGSYNTSYPIVADYELLLRAGSGLKTAFMPQITARMMAGGVSTTRAALKEQARAKFITGGRSQTLSYLEMFFQQIKTFLYPPVRLVLGKLTAYNVFRRASYRRKPFGTLK